MNGWVTVRQVCEALNLSDSTVRRYLRDHKRFIQTRIIGKNRLHISEKSVEIIQKIAYLYDRKLSQTEIEELLTDTQTLTITVHDKDEKRDMTLQDALWDIQNQLEKLTEQNRLIIQENQELRNEVMHLLEKQNEEVKQMLQPPPPPRRKKRSWKDWFNKG